MARAIITIDESDDDTMNLNLTFDPVLKKSDLDLENNMLHRVAFTALKAAADCGNIVEDRE